MKKTGQYLLAVACVAALAAASCREKKKEPARGFISVPSLVKEQIAHVDTSLYLIRKIVITDSLKPDTTFIKREDFGAEAKDFLSVPDLGDKKVASQYKEDPAVFDETLNRVIINYNATDPAKPGLKKQQVLITPSSLEGDKITTLLLNYEVSNRDGYLRKDMLWQMDKSFQVVTITQKQGEPEKTVTTRVTWNEDTEQ